jgi:hypothetical protein
VLLIKFKPPATKKHKIMPRSVNSVARARRKKIMKQAKGFFGDVKRLDSCKECGRESNVLRLP